MMLINICNCFQGSIAYARALCKINLLSQKELQIMNAAFNQVLFFNVSIMQKSLTLSTLQVNKKYLLLYRTPTKVTQIENIF
jgi:hypothetical protein